MDLVERYVHAVGTYLPRAQRDDIVAELAEDVRSQMEDQEAQLGRSLTDAEVDVILVQRGHPLQVATQYLPQRSLIGPTLLPIYFLVLKIVLAVVVSAFALVITPIRVLQGAGLVDALAQSAVDLWFAIWVPFGIVTIIFAVMERSQIAQPSTRWSPRRLPGVSVTGNPNVIARSGTITQGVLTTVFVLWWISGAPFLFINTVPLWRTFTHEAYLPILLLSLGAIALAVANVLRPYWTPLRLGVRAVLDGLSAVVAFAVLQANWAQVTANISAVTHNSGGGASWINALVGLSVAVAVGAIGAIGVVSCGIHAIRCGSSLIAKQR